MSIEASLVEEILLTEENIIRLSATANNIEMFLGDRKKREKDKELLPVAMAVVVFFDSRAKDMGKLFGDIVTELRKQREVHIIGTYAATGALEGTWFNVSTGNRYREGWLALDLLTSALFRETVSPGYQDKDAPNLSKLLRKPITESDHRSSIVLKLGEESSTKRATT